MFQVCFQAAQRIVPTSRDDSKAALRFGETLRVERPDMLTPGVFSLDDAGQREELQVLGYRLPRYAEIVSERGDGSRARFRQLPKQAKPCFIAQRRKQQRGISKP